MLYIAPVPDVLESPADEVRVETINNCWLRDTGLKQICLSSVLLWVMLLWAVGALSTAGGTIPRRTGRRRCIVRRGAGLVFCFVLTKLEHLGVALDREASQPWLAAGLIILQMVSSSKRQSAAITVWSER